MKLFRRNPDNPNCPFSVRFSCRGKIYPFSTKTTDPKLALVRAKQYQDLITAQNYGMADAMKSRNGAVTFRDLFKTYLDLPTPDPLTRKRNVAAMKVILKVSKLGEDSRVDQLSTQVALKYQQHVMATRPGDPSAIVSMNARMRRARSLFSRRAMASYEGQIKVPLEPVQSFFRIPFIKEAEPRKELPRPEAVAKADAELPAYPWEYRCYLLARYAGLRASEIVAARRDWLDGNLLYVGGKPDEFITKSKKWRAVALSDQVVAILLAGDDLFLGGPRRGPIVHRELNAMLLGWGFPSKPLQSLRRLALSHVFTEQGAEAAQKFAGHFSVVTTQRSYAHLLSAPVPIAFSG